MIPRVIFLQDIWHEQLGVEYIAGYLQSHGIACDLYIERAERDLLGTLRSIQPLMICFSSTTGSHLWALKTASRIKSIFRCTIVMGGPHPTFYPQIIEDPHIDIICRGEGEDAVLELAHELLSGKDITGIRNLWVKRNRKIYKNPLRPLVDTLDTLPFPDRSIYDRYRTIRKDTIRPIMSSRGCPYKCSYCFNISNRDLYKGKGKYVRQRSIDSVISECSEVKALYHPQVLNFVDDIFGLDRRWLYSFLEEYDKIVHIPFLCNTRWELLDEDLAKRLKASGCHALQIGIESGDEITRKEVLGRGATNAEIFAKAHMLHTIGMKFRTYNMMGLPEESIDQCFGTLELNAKIGTDYPYVAIFQPYPGTLLGDRAIREGWVTPDFINSMPTTFLKRSVLKLDRPHRYENLHKLFLLIIRFPGLRKLWEKLISLPPNPIFQAVFLLSTGLVYSRLTGRGLMRSIFLGIRHLWFYRENS